MTSRTLFGTPVSDPLKSKDGARVIAGVDVGGTFTDLVIVDQHRRAISVLKTPTTAADPSMGVVKALAEGSVPVHEIDLIIHGTTATTNALLQRRLAKIGMITTAGFRDVIELGRRTRPQAYGLFGSYVPLVPRNLRLEVDERTLADGSIRNAVDIDQVIDAAETLKEAGCEALVIHFLHSYKNPKNEEAALEAAATVWPNNYITAGHRLLSEPREFERGVTASVNAAVEPVLERYINRLRVALHKSGYARDYLVMTGNGGTTSSAHVSREAAKTVMSGPASGVIAAAYTASEAGLGNIITYDMGGTSTDVALVRGSKPLVSNEIALEYGMPIHLPMVDVHTVGAGGGSIAHIDEAGLLRIGPQSAGSDPGPIFYGRGGDRPTISDANLLLGRLNSKRLPAFDDSVDVDAVAAAIMRDVGDGLDLDAAAAAEAILHVATLKMAGAIRMVSVAKGHDPRDFTLFAFGGAGPLHAAAIARELAIPRVLVPALPGLTNALGCAVADLRHDFVTGLNLPVANLDEAHIEAVLQTHVDTGRRMLEAEAVELRGVTVEHSADMQFVGQTHLINVPLPAGGIDKQVLQELFEDAYFARFQVRLPNVEANLVALNSSLIGLRSKPDVTALNLSADHADRVEDALLDQRPVHFGGRWMDTPIYDRARLPLDAVVDGPAIFEQLDTTTVVTPDDRAFGDGLGNIVIEIGQAGHE